MQSAPCGHHSKSHGCQCPFRGVHWRRPPLRSSVCSLVLRGRQEGGVGDQVCSPPLTCSGESIWQSVFIGNRYCLSAIMFCCLLHLCSFFGHIPCPLPWCCLPSLSHHCILSSDPSSPQAHAEHSRYSLPFPLLLLYVLRYSSFFVHFFALFSFLHALPLVRATLACQTLI